MSKKMVLMVLAVGTSILLISSCIGLVSPVSAPGEVAATQGTKEDRIIITWEPVKRAGVYIVYRADSKNGEYEYIASTDGTAYVDVMVAPLLHYWYRIAAADYLGRVESEKLSPAVEGWSIHVFSWSGTAPVLGAAQFDIAANTAVPGEVFLAWSSEGESAVNIEVYRGGEWQDVAESFGITGGGVPGSVSVAAIGGIPYVAYRDETAGGSFTAAYLNGGGAPVWVQLGSAGQGTVPLREIESTFAGASFYVAALDDSEPETASSAVTVFQYDSGTGWQELPSPGLSVSGFSLTNDGSAPVVAYQNETDSVVVLRYDGGWTDTAVPFSYAAADIPDGYIDANFDMVSNALVLAFYDSAVAALKVFTFNGSDWLDISPPVTAAPGAGTVSVSSDQGIPYVFYKDSESNRGTVIRYQGISWQTIAQSEEIDGVTGQYNLHELAIDARQYTIFAFAREGNTINCDIYE